MANQYVNKVIVNNEIKMDLTEDTITPNTLRKGFTAHDASGAPIVGNESLTDISEDGTNAGPILELSAEGWAEQNTTSGKNIISTSFAAIDNNVLSDFTTYTSRGITYTRNDDGSITVTGTATSTSQCVFTTLEGIAGGTYTLSGFPSGVSGSDMYAWDGNTNARPKKSDGTDASSDTGNGSTFIVPDGHIIRVSIRVNSRTTIDATFYPQLEAGSTATEYTPYDGGVQSPSPAYPQEIKVARGRNLLDESAFVNKYWNGDTISSLRARPSHAIKLPVGTTVTVSVDSTFFNTYMLAIIQLNGDYPQSSYVHDTGWTTTGRTFTTVAPYVGIGVKRANDGEVSLADLRTHHIQMEIGSIATPYVPYGHVGMEYEQDLMKLDCLSNGYITSSSGVATISALTQGGAHTWIVDLGESRHSSVLVQVGGDRCRIAEFDSYPKVGLVGKTITYSDVTWYSDTSAEHIVTFVPTKRYLAFFCAAVASNAVEPNPPVSLKLVQTIPIPLPERGWVASLPDGTSDILTLDGAGGYEWELMSKEGVLDGSVACDYMSSTSTTTRARIPAFSDRVMYGSINFFMNKFRRAQSLTGVWPNLAVNEAYLDSAGFVIGLPLNTFSTTADVTAWLASNPVTVLYPLATPTIEHGYVNDWNNDFPLGCTIDIPELRNINVEYFLYDSITQLADDYYDRTTNDISEAMSQTADSATLDALAAIAPIENDISSANYAVGSYLIHDGKLCQVTQAIAANETITVGTNVVLTDVGNELDELNDAVDEINANPYILPTMSESEKGGAKVGEGLSVSNDILNVDMFSNDPNDAGPLLSLQAEGWAEQTQYTGKNLYYWPQTIANKNSFGTATASTNAYGFSVSGTKASGSYADLYFNAFSPAITLYAGQTYVFSDGGATYGRTYRFGDASHSIVSPLLYLGINANASSTTITPNNDITFDRVYFTITTNNAIDVTNTFYPQLEAGSTATSYEPYCGGVPSPNPDYPQDIRVVRSTNLFNARAMVNPSDTRYTADSLVSVAYDGTITGLRTYAQGDDRTASYANALHRITLLDGIYNITLHVLKPTDVASAQVVMFTDNGRRIDQYNNSHFASVGSRTITFGVTGTTNFAIFFKIYTAVIRIQIEREAAHVPQYAGYNCIGLEVYGRNLLNPESAISSSNRRYVYANVKPSTTYTISSNHTTPWKGVRVGVHLMDSERNITDLGWKQLTASSATIQTNADTKKLRLLVSASQTTSTVYNSSESALSADDVRALCLMVEHGSTAHSYEPYNHKHISIPLPSKGFVAALPDGTSDILRLDGAGGYEWVNNTKELSVESFTDFSDFNNCTRVRIGAVSDIRNPRSFIDGLLSNRFIEDSQVITSASTVGGGKLAAYSDKCIYFTFDKEMSGINAWLASNPVTVLYPLATPTTEQGYLPDWDNCIPIHATIDIPELRNIGVECYLNEESARINSQWSKRLKAADDISASNAAMESLASLAPVEGDISSSNYTVGSYLIHNNQLYKVTSPIASGENISVGSNITPVTLSDDVKYLIDHPYILPTMSESTKGGAKVGYGLNVENDILSVGGVDDPNDAGPIVKLNANGWAEQFSTSGRNLLDPSTPKTATGAGITATANSDGRVVITGTSTSSTYLKCFEMNVVLPAGTYTLSDASGHIYSSYVNLRLRGIPESESSETYLCFLANGTSATFTLSKTTTVKSLAFWLDHSSITTNFTACPQLEAGSTATSYEPYTGGAPSPSPSYPQEIKVCRGRNLFNVSEFINFSGILKSSSTWSVSGNELVLVASGSDPYCGDSGQGRTYDTRMGPQFACSADSAYTLSCSNTDFNKFYINFHQSDGTYIDRHSATTSTFTFTTPANCAYFCVRIGKGNAVSGMTYRTTIQLEEGTVPHPYVPYGHVGVDVTYPWTVYKETGAIDVNGGETTSGIHHVIEARLPQGSYHIAYDKTKAGSWMRVHSFKDGSWSKQLASYGSVVAEHVVISFIVDSDTDLVRISIPKDCTNVRIESASSIPIPLPERGYVASLPDGTSDILTLDGAGGYEWELRTNEVTLDGDETWGWGSTWKVPFLPWASNSSIPLMAYTDGNNSTHVSPLSDRFIFKGGYIAHANEKGGFTTSADSSKATLAFTPTDDSITTIELWKTWLSSNPVTVLYPLATPQTESGYIDYYNTIPVHATISSADLEGIEIRCVADAGAAEISAAWGKRIENELNSLREIVNTLLDNS